MGIVLSLYRARIGVFYRSSKVNNIAGVGGQVDFIRGAALGGNFLRVLNTPVRLVFIFAMLSGLLLLCGDIESNPGPVFNRCAACGVMQKDTAKISYFSYPKDPECATLWNSFLSQHQVHSSKHKGFICALHFEPRMFLNDLCNRLQQDAVPTVWSADTATTPSTADIGEHIADQQSFEGHGMSEIDIGYQDDDHCQAKRRCVEITNDRSTSQVLDSQYQDTVNQAGCSIAVINCRIPVTCLPKKRTRESETMTLARLSSNTLRKTKLRKQVKGLSRAKSKLIKQISTMRLKFSEHTKRQSKARSVESLIKEIGQYLHGESLVYVAHLLRMADRAPKGRRFTNEMKQQALLLHNSGPKAYNHLSKIFNLPCKTSLKKWLATMKCLPGFHDECFDTVGID